MKYAAYQQQQRAEGKQTRGGKHSAQLAPLIAALPKKQRALGLHVQAEHVVTREHISEEVARQLAPLKCDAAEMLNRARGDVAKRRPEQTPTQRKLEIEQALKNIPALGAERKAMVALERKVAKEAKQRDSAGPAARARRASAAAATPSGSNSDLAAVSGGGGPGSMTDDDLRREIRPAAVAAGPPAPVAPVHLGTGTAAPATPKRGSARKAKAQGQRCGPQWPRPGEGPGRGRLRSPWAQEGRQHVREGKGLDEGAGGALRRRAERRERSRVAGCGRRSRGGGMD